jgi:hypothetical protein
MQTRREHAAQFSAGTSTEPENLSPNAQAHVHDTDGPSTSKPASGDRQACSSSVPAPQVLFQSQTATTLQTPLASTQPRQLFDAAASARAAPPGAPAAKQSGTALSSSACTACKDAAETINVRLIPISIGPSTEPSVSAWARCRDQATECHGQRAQKEAHAAAAMPRPPDPQHSEGCKDVVVAASVTIGYLTQLENPPKFRLGLLAPWTLPAQEGKFGASLLTRTATQRPVTRLARQEGTKAATGSACA